MTRTFVTTTLTLALVLAACAPSAPPLSPSATQLTLSLAPGLTTPAGTMVTPTPLATIQGIELVGYLGNDQPQTLFIQGDYVYVGAGAELAILDVSNSSRPQRVGYIVLPNLVLDIAVSGDYAYVAAGYSGLHVVDVSNPGAPAVLNTYYPSSRVSRVIVTGSYAYVSNESLRILDISDPATPVEIGVYSSSDPVIVSPVGKVAAVVGDYAYTIYYSNYNKIGGFRIIDVSDRAAPAEVSTFIAGIPVQAMALASDYAYLLVGQGIPRLAIVDISDPENPSEVSLDPMTPWLGQSLAVVDHYIYLADPGGPDRTGRLQVLDVADPSHPVALGRYQDLPPPVADIAIEGEQAHIATADGLVIVNISDPTAPTGAGSYRFDRLPGTNAERPGRDVAVAGDYAYIAAGEDGLQVVDVSDPVNPKVVGSHDTAGHAWDVALAGGYAYVADEYNGLRVINVADPFHPVEVGFYDVPVAFEFFHGVVVANAYTYIADGGLNTGLRVVDVSDPARPSEVSFLSLTAQDTEGFLPPRVEGVAVANGYAYLAAGTAGLRVVDASNPAAPVEVGFYETPGRADNLVVVGRYVYLADGDLRVVDVSDPTAPALVGFYDLPGSATVPYVTVQGHYAFVTGQGLQVLDISDPGAPVEVAAHPIPQGNVAVVGDVAYVISNGLFILRLM